MKYRRKHFRPQRTVEQTATLCEVEELRAENLLLRSRLCGLRQELSVRELEVEQLLQHKVRLATELRDARAALEFLTGGYRGCG